MLNAHRTAHTRTHARARAAVLPVYTVCVCLLGLWAERGGMEYLCVCVLVYVRVCMCMFSDLVTKQGILFSGGILPETVINQMNELETHKKCTTLGFIFSFR